MKHLVTLLSFSCALTHAAPLKPEWTIFEGLENPESSYYDEGSDTIFVSNVAGNPTERDSRGWISQISPIGKVINPKWVGALDAPKGLRSHGKTLWVTNISEIVAINITMAKIIQRIPVPEAKFLNDLAICPDGTLYVSDTLTRRIHSLANGASNVITFVETKESPNGLYCDGKKLWVAYWGNEVGPDLSAKFPGQLASIDLKTKKIENITKPFGNLDGIEPFDGGWLVSDWVAGKVYELNGKKEKVVLTGLKGAADIGWVPNKRLLLVPEMQESRLFAYLLPKLLN